MQDWKTLPNIIDINAVIKSVQADPYLWRSYEIDHDDLFSSKAYADASNKVWDIAAGIVGDDLWGELWAVLDTLPVDQTWFTVRNAIVCLIAHADCSYMLYSNPDELRMLAELGDERASLLFTACSILNGV